MKEHLCVGAFREVAEIVAKTEIAWKGGEKLNVKLDYLDIESIAKSESTILKVAVDALCRYR
jgi:hypothetical protein